MQNTDVMQSIIHAAIMQNANTFICELCQAKDSPAPPLPKHVRKVVADKDATNEQDDDSGDSNTEDADSGAKRKAAAKSNQRE